MKIIKTVKHLFILVIFFSILNSCSFLRIAGNNEIITEERNPKEYFNKISVSTGIDLLLTQNSEGKTTLKIETDNNLTEYLKTKVDGKELKIYFDKNVKTNVKKVYLSTSNTITTITSNTGANFMSKDTIFNDLELKASTGADINLLVKYRNITCSSSTGSSIKIAGSTMNLLGESSSGSSIEATKLLANTTTVEVSSGASIDIYTTKKINAQASSGGRIDYYGTPTSIVQKSTSGGHISKN